MARQSRRKRAAAVIAGLDTFVSWLEEGQKAIEEGAKDLEIDVSALDEPIAEVGNLLEEMSSWRDGLEGTNLEHTYKFELLDEAVNSLEQVLDSLRDVVDVLEGEPGEDELEEALDLVQTAQDELGDIEFPGMF